MNNGAFGENFPYSNFHDLNMDWIIKIAKDFLDQYTDIQDTITTGKTELEELAQQLENLLQEWYDTHSQDIANELATALSQLQAWYNTHSQDISNELATALAQLNTQLQSNILAFNTSANQKAIETLASIPDDYTTLSNRVIDIANELGNITEQTKNLLSTNTDDYRTNPVAPDNAYVSSITKNSITITTAVAGTYRYVFLPVDVSNANNLTVSAESVSGTGEGYLRIGTISGNTIGTWIANGTSTFVTADVSSYNEVAVAIYSTAETSGNIGTYITYNQLQIEYGTLRTDYIYPISCIDSVSRKTLLDTEIKNTNYLCNQYTPTLVDGYVNYHTGKTSTYSGSGTYKRTEYIIIPQNTSIIEMPYSFNGDAGYAFYDIDKNFIAGYITKYDRFIVNNFYTSIPNNARFIILSSYSANTTHPTTPIRFWTHNTFSVTCLGDSITEGMNMDSQRYVEYNGDNYPSHLQTLFYDNNIDAFVYNYGNSGEKTDAVLARLGGKGSAYLGTTVTINAQNDPVDITNNIYSSYTKDHITFTRMDYRSGIATLNGQLLRVQLVNGNLYFNLWEPSGTATQLLGNSPITFGKFFYIRTPNITICYMGINDTSNITFAEWLTRNQIVRDTIGNNRTLIIGTTNPQWDVYPDTRDLPDPVKYYNQKCAETFGDFFVNLFPIMCQQKGIEIAQEGGYLLDRTQSEIIADNTAIASWKVPPSLTEDGTTGNVHFNNVGYYVMARIIFDRMQDLNLI